MISLSHVTLNSSCTIINSQFVSSAWASRLNTRLVYAAACLRSAFECLFRPLTLYIFVMKLLILPPSFKLRYRARPCDSRTLVSSHYSNPRLGWCLCRVLPSHTVLTLITEHISLNYCGLFTCLLPLDSKFSKDRICVLFINVLPSA